jgi:hypothetical protein
VSAIRLTGSTSGYAEITPSAVAGDVQLVLPSTAGTLDRLNRAGNVLQVVQMVKTDTFSNIHSYQLQHLLRILGLTATITPSSLLAHKILILLDATVAITFLRLPTLAFNTRNFRRKQHHLNMAMLQEAEHEQ